MAFEQAATVAAEPTNSFFDHQGLKLHYLDWGGDPTPRTFVLLHGGGVARVLNSVGNHRKPLTGEGQKINKKKFEKFRQIFAT